MTAACVTIAVMRTSRERKAISGQSAQTTRRVVGFALLLKDTHTNLTECFLEVYLRLQKICSDSIIHNSRTTNKALDFASQFDTITQEERDIITHAKRSFLHSDESTWGKTEAEDLFDVTMGSWDGAETCELVGSYNLCIIKEKNGNNIGLYRDDGLGAFNATPQQGERIKKSICKSFKDNRLKITIEVNLIKHCQLSRRNLRPLQKQLRTIYESQ